MVLLQNINIGQHVEVWYRGGLYRGTVKFKGFLNGVAGEWVGVELNNPVGKHDGMVQGRRYFSCQSNHGIFTDASNIRFIRSVRYLRDPYHCVNKDSRESEVEEELFGHGEYSMEKNNWQEPSYITADNKLFYRSLVEDNCRWSKPCRSFHLPHSVGNQIPAATILRPHTARSLYTTYTGRPLHYEYEDTHDFITTPSIPKIHMPYDALRQQVGCGWRGSHYVREMSINTGRDSIKFDQWNDIH